jgi:hypothetical protein
VSPPGRPPPFPALRLPCHVSYIDQLDLILKTLGTPDEATLDRVGSEKACAYIRSLPRMEKVPFVEIFPDAEPEGGSRTLLG